MAALLQLYTLALRGHAACAALQPQIAPLPGQATDLQAASEKSSSSGHVSLGCFDAISAADKEGQTEAALPSLSNLWEHHMTGKAPCQISDHSSVALGLEMI